MSAFGVKADMTRTNNRWAILKIRVGIQWYVEDTLIKREPAADLGTYFAEQRTLLAVGEK
jgi:hypothetical protein